MSYVNESGYIARVGQSSSDEPTVVYNSLTELQAAFDQYTASNSVTPTVFQLGPGTISVPGAFGQNVLTVPANCTLRGTGMDTTIIAGENQGFIWLLANSAIEDLQVRRRWIATSNEDDVTVTTRRVFFNQMDEDGKFIYNSALAYRGGTHNVIDCEYRLNAETDGKLISLRDPASSMVIHNLRNRRADKNFSAQVEGGFSDADGGSIHATNCEFGTLNMASETVVYTNCIFRPFLQGAAVAPFDTQRARTQTFNNCVFDMTRAGAGPFSYGRNYALDVMNLINCSVVGNTTPMSVVGSVTRSNAVS